jgi:hypothetical protein
LENKQKENKSFLQKLTWLEAVINEIEDWPKRITSVVSDIF